MCGARALLLAVLLPGGRGVLPGVLSGLLPGVLPGVLDPGTSTPGPFARGGATPGQHGARFLPGVGHRSAARGAPDPSPPWGCFVTHITVRFYLPLGKLTIFK